MTQTPQHRFALLLFLLLLQIEIAYSQDSTPILYPGMYQAQDLATYIQNARPMNMAGVQSGEAMWSEGFSAQVYGTDVAIRFHLGPQLAARGNANLPPPDADGWYETVTPLSLSAASHTLNLGTPEYPIILDSITVYDRTRENLFPLVGGVAIAVGMLAFVLILALWERQK